MTRARRELDSLEQEIERGAANVSVRQQSDANKQIKITYLRSTPGPGTQAGGAASHIKGVIEGLLELDAKVELISNDVLIGLDPASLPITTNRSRIAGNNSCGF